MTLLSYICLGAAVLFLLIVTVWRVSSRRASLPCPTWLAWLVELDNPIAKNNNAHRILEQLDVHPGMRVLDVGCGPGRLTIPIAQRVGPRGSVTAIDVQPGMLRRAKEKAKVAGAANIQFLEIAIGQGTPPGGQYDRALLVTVLGEIPDRQAALKEIDALLKPGGVLAVTEIIFDPHYQRRQAILQLASSAGFLEKAYFGSRLSFTLTLEKPGS